MNREKMIDAIVEAYMDSIMCVNFEDWIENILRHGHEERGLETLNDEDLKCVYEEWVGELEEEEDK